MMVEKRKPVAGKATGFLNGVSSLATLDTPDISETRTERQAQRICDRFAVSWPVARAIAELAYGGAA